MKILKHLDNYYMRKDLVEEQKSYSDSEVKEESPLKEDEGVKISIPTPSEERWKKYQDVTSCPETYIG